MNDERDRTMKRGYWYKHYVEECVLCDRITKWKVKIRGIPKPTDKAKQLHYEEVVCGEHFVERDI